ncbi:MAG: Gfo/Idh/MocA family oxidoreductase [Actinobacteria bacterium]|nr:Gfo/Idh/MocA family oxidoreductase [Actinomycetota bacterium]
MTTAVDPDPVSRGTVRWGILATGGVARLFARDLRTHGHRVTAVGSRTLAGARSFAEQFGIPRAHGSYDELVADPEVDVVYVATTHDRHAENAQAALAQGKHVLVEKPFTVNAAQAQQVVDLGRRRGLLVMEAMWTRFLPHMRFVREAVAAGRIGEVRSLHADHTQLLPSDPSHRLNDPRRGGGALLDLGVYPLSLAHDLLGVPDEVTAVGELAATGVDASVATILRHDRGALSTSFSSMRTRGPNRAVVLGTSGRLEIAPVWYAPTEVEVRDHRGEVVDRFDAPVSGRGMQYQATEVERLIEDGEVASPLMSPGESVAVMATLDRVRAAIGLRYPGE